MFGAGDVEAVLVDADLRLVERQDWESNHLFRHREFKTAAKFLEAIAPIVAQPVLPALLPGKSAVINSSINSSRSSPLVGHAATQDPLTFPSERQIREKTAHPVCCLTPSLTAGVLQIEVLAPIAMNLRSCCAVFNPLAVVQHLFDR